MSDQRATVTTNGIGFVAATYKTDGVTITYDNTVPNGTTQAGLAVTLAGDGTVALAGDGEYVAGKLLSVDSDGFAAVQVSGFADLPAGSGATLTLGAGVVGALSGTDKGYVRAVNTATAAELGFQNGKIIDASDTTSVIVGF